MNAYTRFGFLAAMAIVTAFTSTTPVLAGLITPADVVASTINDHDLVGNLINNSGLSGPPFDSSSVHTGDSVFEWVTDGVGFPFDYFNSRPAPVVTFDLGGKFELSAAVIWNYAGGLGGGSGNGASSITIDFSSEGMAGPFASGFQIHLAQGLNAPALTPSESFPFINSVLVNAVRFTITDNYWPSSGGDRVGLAEVKFVGRAVPEPSGAVLALLSAAALILGTWKRRWNAA